MRLHLYSIFPQVFAACAVLCPIVANGQSTAPVDTIFNYENVILPSSRYTPSQQYKAQTFVITGPNYSDANYNKVWGMPLDDVNGKKWYENDYQPTNGRSSWRERQSPFNSDPVYKGYSSYQWCPRDVVADIYIRRPFTITSPLPDDIFLACGHDDAPSEWYINGKLVHSVSDGWNYDEYVMLTAEQRALIKTDGSENIIAVHVHQNWGGAFADCGLYGADIAIVTPLLPTKPAGGDWYGHYYFLSNNKELNNLDPAEWAGNDEKGKEAEADFQSPYTEAGGYGPYGNDQFNTTYWGSDLYPLLVRRHFNLTDAELKNISSGNVTLTCSFDEFPKIYLNGTLIWQHDGSSDVDYASYNLTADQKSLLVNGDNVLAASVQQSDGGGHIDYGLEIRQTVATGIRNIVSYDDKTQKTDAGIYSLSGVYMGTKMRNLPAGIYIINGKKIIKR